ISASSAFFRVFSGFSVFRNRRISRKPGVFHHNNPIESGVDIGTDDTVIRTFAGHGVHQPVQPFMPPIRRAFQRKIIGRGHQRYRGSFLLRQSHKISAPPGNRRAFHGFISSVRLPISPRRQSSF
ncbi:MAG: hypothetical protein ACKV2V_01345, partial [Blastocatellia bacterium]